VQNTYIRGEQNTLSRPFYVFKEETERHCSASHDIRTWAGILLQRLYVVPVKRDAGSAHASGVK